MTTNSSAGGAAHGYYRIPKPELVGEILLEAIIEAKRINTRFDEYELAAALGLPLEIYKGRVAAAESERLKKLPRWELGTPLSITGDVMVVGDVHCPFTDIPFAALVGQIGKKHLKKPRQLVIAGDFFNLDLFSDFYQIIRGPDWHDEKQAAIALAQEWGSVFDTIYYLSGNHDRRVSKKTSGEMDVRDLADFLSLPITKVKPSLLGYANLHSNGAEWRITHAREYSINRLTVANELSVKFQSNIISFHEHHLAMGWDRYHRYVIINGGSLVDQSQLAYCTLDDTKRPNFDTGFVMVKNGYPYLFGKAPFTRWEDWL